MQIERVMKSPVNDDFNCHIIFYGILVTLINQKIYIEYVGSFFIKISLIFDSPAEKYII